MRPYRTVRAYLALALLAGVFVCAAPALADPPGRVGRIAWLEGSGAVHLQDANSGTSTRAPLNQPLTSGDILSTDPDTRAEVQIGSTTVRLEGNTRLEFDRIDDQAIHAYLADGQAFVKLTEREVLDDFELETRNGRFSARETGVFRFGTDEDGSDAMAFYGKLRFDGDDRTVELGAGEHARLWHEGDPGETRYRLLPQINDDFTRWSAERDRAPSADTYARYVSPEMTGAGDLDRYGSWTENPDYGAIWFPRTVRSDWAPYRSGHWAWVDPWGWSWVDDEPWGFAPFHYGRWVHHHGRWGWVPGVRVARPVYAPALVAWIGSPGIDISISIGSSSPVGWFPLAPREVYVPPYRVSPTYVRTVNITHVTHITNVTNIVSHPQTAVRHMRYAHRNQPQALTVVRAGSLGERRPVERAMLSPSDVKDLQRTRAWREQSPLAAAPVTAPARAGKGRPPRVERGQRPEPERSRQEQVRSESRQPRRDLRGAESVPAQRAQDVTPRLSEQNAPHVAPRPQRGVNQPEVQPPRREREEAKSPVVQLPKPAAGRVDRAAPVQGRREAASAAKGRMVGPSQPERISPRIDVDERTSPPASVTKIAPRSRPESEPKPSARTENAATPPRPAVAHETRRQPPNIPRAVALPPPATNERQQAKPPRTTRDDQELRKRRRNEQEAK
jgi:hypothetical protein